jgi:hypothetical protein
MQGGESSQLKHVEERSGEIVVAGGEGCAGLGWKWPGASEGDRRGQSNSPALAGSLFMSASTMLHSSSTPTSTMTSGAVAPSPSAPKSAVAYYARLGVIVERV